jgi:hypothetical protein
MDSSALILIDDESDHAVDPECLEPERRRRRRADSRVRNRPALLRLTSQFVAMQSSVAAGVDCPWSPTRSSGLVRIETEWNGSGHRSRLRFIDSSMVSVSPDVDREGRRGEDLRRRLLPCSRRLRQGEPSESGDRGRCSGHGIRSGQSLGWSRSSSAGVKTSASALAWCESSEGRGRTSRRGHSRATTVYRGNLVRRCAGR